jgi:hypothetical protein
MMNPTRAKVGFRGWGGGNKTAKKKKGGDGKEMSD